MGRQSKSTQARLKNLQKATNTKKATVEDASDKEDEEHSPSTCNSPPDLLAEGFFILDETSDCESDADSDFGDDGIDKDELTGLESEADIHLFNSILAEAQAVAAAAEREQAESKPKRKRHYTGNSSRTKHRYSLVRRQLHASSQKSINSIFTKKERIDVEDDTEDEPEIEERVECVFMPIETAEEEVSKDLIAGFAFKTKASNREAQTYQVQVRLQVQGLLMWMLKHKLPHSFGICVKGGVHKMTKKKQLQTIF